jgi:hypothetical protein
MFWNLMLCLICTSILHASVQAKDLVNYDISNKQMLYISAIVLSSGMQSKIITTYGICIIYEEGYLSMLQLVHVLTT